MVEKEKSVAELTAELDAIATIPEDFEDVKPPVIPKKPDQVLIKPPQQSSAPIPTVLPTPSQPIKAEPAIQQEPVIQQPPIPKEHPSIDNMLEKIKANKFRKIDEEAAIKKMQAENGLYEGLEALIELAASGKVISAQSIPQQPLQVERVVVKNNSEAIAAIDVQLADETVKDKVALLRVKRQLQGQPFTHEDEVMFSTPIPTKKTVDIKQPTEKKEYSIKVALAAFALVALSTGSVYYLLSAVLHVGG